MASDLAQARIGVVHEWLVTRSGSEHVLEQILQVFPAAQLYCTADFLSEKDAEFLNGRRRLTTFVQSLPFARKRYRSYLPLMPIAIEQLDLSAYDLVISSSHAVAKGVLTRPDQLHVSYVHTPCRYAWDLQKQYLDASKLHRGIRSAAARALLHYFRMWDVAAASRVDSLIANSSYVAERIRKFYRREAQVIYPPVDVEKFPLRHNKSGFYLTVSRLVPYKRVDLLVEAFARMPGRELIVIGDGPEFKRLRAKAQPNVKLLGYQPSNAVRDYMQRARAFLFAAEEDFGIAPLEAQACGTPVIAYGRGGVTETIVDGVTGVFFYGQTAEAVVEAVERFERAGSAIDPRASRSNAERFRPERFRREFREFLEGEWAGFQAGRRLGGAVHSPKASIDGVASALGTPQSPISPV